MVVFAVVDCPTVISMITGINLKILIVITDRIETCEYYYAGLVMLSPLKYALQPCKGCGSKRSKYKNYP